MTDAVAGRIGMLLQERYRVLEAIASGAMGSVYRGERLELHRAVAIKFLHTSLANHPELRKRFELEARAMSLLSHPNCVSIIDYGVADAPYLVMDFVTGKTLRSIMDAGRMSTERALGIMRQILAGLAHAHKHGIVHRDLKPSNIVITEDLTGTGDYVRILDFGLAKLRDAGLSVELTQGNHALGTPNYMSPEQVRGDPVDARSDVYAVGVLLFEMLSGSKPFRADDTLEVLFMQRDHPPPPLRTISSATHLSGEMEALLLKAMAKAPEERYQSVSELLVALQSTPEHQGQQRGAVLSPVAEPAVQRARIPAAPIIAPNRPVSGEGTASYVDEPKRATAEAPPLPPPDVPSTSQSGTVQQQEESRIRIPLSGPRPWLVVALGVTGVVGLWLFSSRSSGPSHDAARLRQTEPHSDNTGAVGDRASARVTPVVGSDAAVRVTDAGLAPSTVHARAVNPDVDALPSPKIATTADATLADAVTAQASTARKPTVVKTTTRHRHARGRPVARKAEPSARAEVHRLAKLRNTNRSIHGLRLLAAKHPRSALIPYTLGGIYFRKRAPLAGVQVYGRAIKHHHGYRRDPKLIRNVISALGSSRAWRSAENLLVQQVGNSALSSLQRAARVHPNRLVRARAKSLIAKLRRRSR